MGCCCGTAFSSPHCPGSLPVFLPETSFSPGKLWSQLHVSVSMPPTSSGEGVWAWCSPSCKQRAKSWLQTCLCPGEPRPGELQGEHLAYLGHHGMEG